MLSQNSTHPPNYIFDKSILIMEYKIKTLNCINSRNENVLINTLEENLMYKNISFLISGPIMTKLETT